MSQTVVLTFQVSRRRPLQILGVHLQYDISSLVNSERKMNKKENYLFKCPIKQSKFGINRRATDARDEY